MPSANKSYNHENSSVLAVRRRRNSDSPVCSNRYNGLFRQRSAAATSFGAKPPAASPSGLVRPYSRSGDCLGSPHRNSRPSWTGCSVSISTMVRASGSPAAKQRSQKPVTMSSSAVPVRPACVSHAETSAKTASFILRLYRGEVAAGSVRDASHLADKTDIAAVAIGGMQPAVLVIIGHALLGERLHLLERAGTLRLLQLKDADQFVAAGIIHLIELVTRAEFAADRVPQELHDLDALLVIDAVRAAHIFGEAAVDFGIFEIADMRRQVDQARGDHLFDDVAHRRIGFRHEQPVGGRAARIGKDGAVDPRHRVAGHGIRQ